MKSPSPTEREALFRLFGTAADGTLTDQQSAELEQALASSPAARKLWFLHQDLELGLEEWAAARSQETAALLAPPQRPTLVTPPAPITLPRPLPRRAAPTAWLAIAAALTAALGIALWTLSSKSAPPPLATLSRGTSTQWAGPAIHTGARFLSPQSLDLTSGIVELSMSSGAIVVFEGPGRMEILSENSVHLHSGRLHATVPPAARGFTVTGNGFSAVDHGTRFGCAVNDAAPAEIHVFEGEVELLPNHQPNRWLRTNQALAIHPAAVESIPPRPELFISPADLDTLANNPAALRTRASELLKNHPAAILHLDAADTAAVTLHHTTLAPGRDPARNALAFDGISSHLTLQLNHHPPALTLLAWVRSEESRRRHDLLSAMPPLGSGDIAWYRHQYGVLGFGALQPIREMSDRGWRSLHSAPLSATLADWSLVAVVADAKAGTVTHFLNGKVVGMGQVSLPPSLHLGNLMIGATMLDSQTLSHQFRGSLDELAIIAAPLSPTEIARIYQLGRPTP